MPQRKYVVFDIETSPLPWESLSPSQQEYLLRGCETEEDIEKEKERLALSPFTAQLVCVALGIYTYEHSSHDEEGELRWDVEREGVLMVDPSMEEKQQREEKLSDNTPVIFAAEREVLRLFWMILKKYAAAHFVTFNGRNFDAPFLMLRSAILRIRPSLNLMAGTRWRYDRHTDLADELSYYGYGSSGPQRRYNFDFYAHAFGIPSPKSEEMHGKLVADYYREQNYLPIAEYCLKDVRATWELFLHWDRYLRFEAL